MAEPFATVAELATFMQTATEAEAEAGSPDLLDTLIATQALSAASGAIRAACGWTISEETVTGEVVEECGGRIFFPTLRLTALALSVGGVPMLEGTDFTVRSNGVVTLAAFRAWSYAPILATYTHGYSVVPDEVKAVCLEQAAQRLGNPEHLVSQTIGGTTEVYRRSGEMVVDLAADARLHPFRLLAVA